MSAARGKAPAHVAATAYAPRQVAVRVDGSGTPVAVEGRGVATVRERWLVEDRWWSPRPLRRAYFDLVLVSGGNEVVYRDLVSGRWHRQRD